MTDGEIRFPSLGDAIAGRLTTGVVKGAVALLLAWIITLFIDVDMAFDRMAVALVLAFVLSEIAGAVIERPIVLRDRRPNPGGFAYVFLPFTASIVISFVASYALHRSISASAVVTAAVAICNLAELLWMKSWIPGPTPEEEQATIDEFTAMTKEHFADDVEEIKRGARERTRDRYYKKKARDEAKAQKRKGDGKRTR